MHMSVRMKYKYENVQNGLVKILTQVSNMSSGRSFLSVALERQSKIIIGCHFITFLFYLLHYHYTPTEGVQQTGPRIFALLVGFGLYTGSAT